MLSKGGVTLREQLQCTRAAASDQHHHDTQLHDFRAELRGNSHLHCSPVRIANGQEVAEKERSVCNLEPTQCDPHRVDTSLAAGPVERIGVGPADT